MPEPPPRAPWFRPPNVRLGLRWAMLLAMAPILLLPLSGLLFLAELSTLTRDERSEQLASAARGYAGALHERRDLFGPRPTAGLPGDAQTMPVATAEAIRVDGVADDWREIVAMNVPSQPLGDAPADTLQVRLAAVRVPGPPARLYLLVEVYDERYLEPEPRRFAGADNLRVFQRGGVVPADGERDGDALLVEAGPAFDDLRALDVAITPGADAWRAELPLPADTRFLRVRVRDVDYQASRRLEAAADSGLLALGVLADGSDAVATLRADARQAAILDLLRGFARGGARVTVLDREGRPLASLGSIDADERPAADSALGRWLVGWAVAISTWADDPARAPEPRAQALRGFPATRSERLARPDGAAYWLTTSAQPIWFDDRVAGALVLEQADDSDLARAQSAFEWLAQFTALAVVAAMLTLLGFASLTVARIRRLKRAAEQAIDLRGRVTGRIPRFQLRDEIASLADGYERVLARLREHQQYLANLRARLVHELRTPIMVVRSSLDNLGDVVDEAAPESAYVQRAIGGTLRLERIVASMSEAANLESMLGDSPLERVDLAALLRELVDAYNQAWGAAKESGARVRFAFETALAHAPAAVVPEAIAQAVDKLASNARDFAAPGSVVRLRLSVGPTPGGEAGYRIVMHNEGPPLPELMADNLFDSMVSVRGEVRAGASHLGLGLYLVRLIAEFHGGGPVARNEAGGVGIGFTIAPGQMPIDDGD